MRVPSFQVYPFVLWLFSPVRRRTVLFSPFWLLAWALGFETTCHCMGAVRGFLGILIFVMFWDTLAMRFISVCVTACRVNLVRLFVLLRCMPFVFIWGNTPLKGIIDIYIYQEKGEDPGGGLW